MAFLGGLFNAAGEANKYLEQGIATRNKALTSVSGSYQPFTAPGAPAMGTLSGLLGLPGSDPNAAYDQFRAAPGYQVGLNEGVNAIDASAAARGLGGSGATLQALDKFGQNYADKGFQQYFQNVQGVGQQAQGATENLGGLKLNVANNNAGSLQQMGENKANQSNATLGMLGGIAGNVFKLFGG